MRYVFGNDYGDLGNRELATDAASDNRYFQSLAAQRAADAAAAQQAQFGQQYQLSLADLGQRRAETHYNHQIQLAHYLSQLDQNRQMMDWHRANNALEGRKVALGENQFDWTKSQPTTQELNEKEKQAQIKAADDNNLQVAKNVADTLNQFDAVTARERALPTQDLFDQTKNNYSRFRWWIPGMTGRDKMAANALTPQMSGEINNDQPYDVGAMTFAQRLGLAQKPVLERKAALLDSIKNIQKQGLMQYVTRDPKTGSWVPTYKPRFNLSGAIPAGTAAPGRSILRFDPMTGSVVRPADAADLSDEE
jgi:hypothetical protein